MFIIIYVISTHLLQSAAPIASLLWTFFSFYRKKTCLRRGLNEFVWTITFFPVTGVRTFSNTIIYNSVGRYIILLYIARALRTLHCIILYRYRTADDRAVDVRMKTKMFFDLPVKTGDECESNLYCSYYIII